MSDQRILQSEKTDNGTRKKAYSLLEALDSTHLLSIERNEKKTIAWWNQESSRLQELSRLQSPSDERISYLRSRYEDLFQEFQNRRAEDEEKSMRVIGGYTHNVFKLLEDRDKIPSIQKFHDDLLKWAKNRPYISAVSQSIGSRTASEGSRSTNCDTPSSQTSTSTYAAEDKVDDDVIIGVTRKRKAHNAAIAEEESRPPKRREALRTPQWNRPPTDRQISFREVFKDGKPEHEIQEWPKASGSMYIIMCEEHNLGFGRKMKDTSTTRERVDTMRQACRHLRHYHNETDLDGRKSHEGVIINMGIHVLDCTKEDQALNNEAFDRLVANRELAPSSLSGEERSNSRTPPQQVLESSSFHNSLPSPVHLQGDSTVDGAIVYEPCTMPNDSFGSTDGMILSPSNSSQDFNALLNDDSYMNPAFEGVSWPVGS